MADQLDLAPNVHLATLDVDILGREREDLALSHPESGTEPDHELVARRQLVPDGEHPIAGPGHDLAVPLLRAAYGACSTRVATIKESSIAAVKTVDTFAKMICR